MVKPLKEASAEAFAQELESGNYDSVSFDEPAEGQDDSALQAMLKLVAPSLSVFVRSVPVTIKRADLQKVFPFFMLN